MNRQALARTFLDFWEECANDAWCDDEQITLAYFMDWLNSKYGE